MLPLINSVSVSHQQQLIDTFCSISSSSCSVASAAPAQLHRVNLGRLYTKSHSVEWFCLQGCGTVLKGSVWAGSDRLQNISTSWNTRCSERKEMKTLARGSHAGGGFCSQFKWLCFHCDWTDGSAQVRLCSNQRRQLDKPAIVLFPNCLIKSIKAKWNRTFVSCERSDLHRVLQANGAIRMI